MDNMPPTLVLSLMATVLVAAATISFTQFVGMEGSPGFVLFTWIAFVVALTVLGFWLARTIGKRRHGAWAAADIWITTLAFALVAGGGTAVFLFYPFLVVGVIVAFLVFAVFGIFGEG